MRVEMGDFVVEDQKDSDGCLIRILGVVERLCPGFVYYREVHALHELWGGSSGQRGRLHKIKPMYLRAPTTKEKWVIIGGMKTKSWARCQQEAVN